MDESYQKSIKKIIDFLKGIYKNNIPKNFYNEIFKNSSIDFIYYANTLTMVKDLIQGEITKAKIDKGIYLLGNYYIKEHLNLSSNEYTIILSFQLLNNANDVSIFNLVRSGKGIILISIKNDCLHIGINNDLKWNTNIKINKKVIYFLIISYNKKNKILKLYLNHDEISNKKIDEKKIEKGNISIPKFTKDMDCVIGDAKLYIIIGDVFLINKEFDISIVIQLFDLKGYYSNLIIRNNVNCELMKNINYSKKI